MTPVMIFRFVEAEVPDDFFSLTFLLGGVTVTSSVDCAGDSVSCSLLKMMVFPFVSASFTAELGSPPPNSVKANWVFPPCALSVNGRKQKNVKKAVIILFMSFSITESTDLSSFGNVYLRCSFYINSL